MSHHVLQASTLGMVPPRYVWIAYEWYPEAFWKQSLSNGTSYEAFDQCSREQILSIVNQMIVIYNYPYYSEKDEGNPIIGNLVRASHRNVEEYFEFLWNGKLAVSFACRQI